MKVVTIKLSYQIYWLLFCVGLGYIIWYDWGAGLGLVIGSFCCFMDADYV